MPKNDVLNTNLFPDGFVEICKLKFPKNIVRKGTKKRFSSTAKKLPAFHQ